MEVGAVHRPFEQVSTNVIRSTASRTAYTAVPLSSILQHDIDVAIERYDDGDNRFTASDSRNAHSTAINDPMNSRKMHYTAMNAPVVSSTTAANAAMAEIGRFSRSYSNNDRMQSGGNVCMSDVCSARMHEVDTFDLTGLFCRAQARAQQAQRSQQLYTLVDEDYPSAGQRPPNSPPQPTQQTQASTTQQTYASQQLQPTQQADLFQQEHMAMADAAMQQRHALPASPALALTDVHQAVPPPATAETSHLALTSTPVAAHYSALQQCVPMQPGQRCGPHLPRSKRPASDDSYIELDSTVSIRRRLQHTARPRAIQQTDATRPTSQTRSRVPETTSMVSRHSRRNPPSVHSDRTMVSNRSVPVTEVVNMVHKFTDTVVEMNRQTRDDAVARERLLLQQQQLLQRDFVEREDKLLQQQQSLQCDFVERENKLVEQQALLI